jgi:predicted DNA-binding protein
MADPIHSFRLPEELGDQLEQAKWALQRSKSDIVKEALTAYFAKVKRPKAKQAKAPKGNP